MWLGLLVVHPAAVAAAVFVLGDAVGIGAVVGRPVTVVESVRVRQLKPGTCVQLLHVPESRQPLAVLDETVGVQREAADVGIPTETRENFGSDLSHATIHAHFCGGLLR